MTYALIILHIIAHAALIALGLYGALATFFTLYIAAINVYGDRETISPVLFWAMAPMMITMLACDFCMQMTLATAIFLDLPRELTVTSRLKRYEAGPPGWRQHWAIEICTQGLNPFAPNKHHC